MSGPRGTCARGHGGTPNNNNGATVMSP